MLSDDSTSDSDTGIRFKTDSTRRPTTGNDLDKDNNRDRNDRRNNDSGRRNESYSSSRNNNSRSTRDLLHSRERSPLRDRQKSRTDSGRPENSHRKERIDRENGSSHNSDRKSQTTRDKPQSESIRKSDDRYSKSGRNEIDKRTDNHRDLKPSESKRDHKSVSENREKHDNIRNMINKHLQAAKEDKKPSINNERSRHSSEKKHEDHARIKFNDSRKSGDSKVRSEIKNLDKHPTNNHSDEQVRKSRDRSDVSSKNKYSPSSSSTHRSIDTHIELSDHEQKPVSYYNMISADIQNDTCPIEVMDREDEPIAVSDSSVDEGTLRKQALLLKEELKGTKEKRKSKHKDKKRCRKKRLNKILKDGETVSESISSYVESETPPKSSTEKPSDESNEEGEIVSDSDEKSFTATIIDSPESFPNKPQMPDLRERLSSKFTKAENVFGPTLPPRLKPKERITEDVDEVEGPALPPHLLKPTSTKHVGPQIPSDIRQKLAEKPYKKYDSESDDDCNIGPLPVGSEEKWTKAHKTLEERALKLKINAIDASGVKESQAESREEWMLKLPDAKIANLGLTTRQFRAKEGPDLSDRSSWTDTPEVKSLKESGIIVENEADSSRLQKDAESKFIKQRDADQEDIIRKYKKKNKRDSSLLEMHEKKLKKKKKKCEKEKEERRPFSRDNDLKVNRFDEVQKKAIIKKAMLLDSRFSKGESKYL